MLLSRALSKSLCSLLHGSETCNNFSVGSSWDLPPALAASSHVTLFTCSVLVVHIGKDNMFNFFIPQAVQLGKFDGDA